MGLHSNSPNGDEKINKFPKLKIETKPKPRFVCKKPNQIEPEMEIVEP